MANAWITFGCMFLVQAAAEPTNPPVRFVPPEGQAAPPASGPAKPAVPLGKASEAPASPTNDLPRTDRAAAPPDARGAGAVGRPGTSGGATSPGVSSGPPGGSSSPPFSPPPPFNSIDPSPLPANRPSAGSGPGGSSATGLPPGRPEGLGYQEKATISGGAPWTGGTSTGDGPRTAPAPGGSLTPGAPPPASAPPIAPVLDRRRTSPPEMVAELLKLPDRAPITGRPVTLLEALINARDRARQLEVTHAYWRLVQALAEYRVAYDLSGRLVLQERPEDAAVLRTARASAAAGLQAAELAVVRAQHELGEAGAMNPGLPPPLPADPPHVGPYRTGFDEVYATRGVPSRARLIHRLLPVRGRAIDVRSMSAQAADDAVVAALEAYRLSHVDLPAVLASIEHWTAERRALIAAVCDYNHDIVEYAVAVTGPAVSSQTLVSMLIRTSSNVSLPTGAPLTPGGQGQPAGRGAAAPSPSGILPAEYQSWGPVPDMGAASLIPSTVGVPGIGAGYAGAAMKDEPTLAPPRTGLPPAEKDGPTLAPPRPRSKPADGEPARIPERPATPAEDLEKPSSSLPRPMEPVQRAAYRAFYGAAPDSASALALYLGLADTEPGQRAKQLSAALQINRNLPKEPTQAVELAECLRSFLSADRRGLIEAYWTAQQRAAEYQVIAQQLEFLEPLAATALANRNRPSGSREMLRVRAAQLTADADRLDGEVDLLRAEFELTERAGRPLESSWLLPATAPHAGPYQLNLEARPRDVASSWPVRRLAATIPAQYETLRRRAAAVVTADLARAAETAAYQAGTGPLDRLLPAIRVQTRETLSFLDALGRYNRSIAEYVLAVVPPGLSGDQLLQTLVVVR